MSEKIYQNVLIESAKLFCLFVLVFIFSTSIAIADSQHYKDPALSKENSPYLLPDNLSNISLTDLKTIKQTHAIKLGLLQQSDEACAISEKKLLNSLIAYDDVRLQIADIILKLTKEYEVTGKYRKKLLGYSDTFATRIKLARNTLETLDDYKVYDTHFAVAYISLLYAFKEDPAFYQQYMKDINDPISTIGKYRRELDASYKDVERAQQDYESIAIARKLMQSVVQLDKEIYLRETRLNAQK